MGEGGGRDWPAALRDAGTSILQGPMRFVPLSEPRLGGGSRTMRCLRQCSGTTV